MRHFGHLLLVAVFATWVTSSCRISGEPAQLEKIELTLHTVFITEGGARETIFVINNHTGYKTVESLKAFLAAFPPGARLTWFPVPRGGVRLPPDDRGLDDFKKFCAEHKIELTIIPGE
jgi:hypothetical protein